MFTRRNRYSSLMFHNVIIFQCYFLCFITLIRKIESLTEPCQLKELNFYLNSRKQRNAVINSNANRLYIFFSLSKYFVLLKMTSYLDIFNPDLFVSCTFKITMFGFISTIGRILYFCSNNGPLPNVIFSALYLKNSLLD